MEAGSTTDSRPEVLIVEDEESLAELFGTYLADEYIVKPVRNTHPTPRFPACVPENIPSRPPAVRTSLSALPDLNEPRRSCSLPAVATRACDSSAHIGSG